MEEAVALVIKVMSKTMDSTTLGSEKREEASWTLTFYHLSVFELTTFLVVTVEFATMTLDKTTKQPRAKIFRPAEVDALLAKHGIAKKSDDVEMK